MGSRDREISRLNQLLIGGRPLSALAKDCCYRGVGALSEDMQELQKEKARLQQQLETCLRKHHDAMDRAIAVDQQNKQLTQQLNNIQEVALSVETEANTNLSTLHKQNVKLKAKVNEQQQLIDELEEKVHAMDESLVEASDMARLRSAYREAKIEIKMLQSKLELLTGKGMKWQCARISEEQVKNYNDFFVIQMTSGAMRKTAY